MTKLQFFIEENRIAEKRQKIYSPSKQYLLIIDHYKTREGAWNYTRGRFYKNVGEGTLEFLRTVHRNYNHFWYCFIEDHPDGNDYALCGEDYQGQTLVNLTTREKVNYLPVEARQEAGFCWAEVMVSPDKLKLAVDGCYWACSYDLVIYDFSDPMHLPYKEIFNTCGGYEEYKWIDNNTIEVGIDTEYRKSDGKLYNDLTDEEQKLLDKNDSLIGWKLVKETITL